MDINININADEKLIAAIIKTADAIELVAKRGIGKALYESELIQTIADEVTNKVTKEEAPVVQATQVSYDINQLAVAATGLMDAGKQQDLMNLLAKFGVQALTQLPKEQYGAFATELRALGANI